MIAVTIPKFGAFEAWRLAARRCVEARIRPEDILWQREGGARSLFAEELPTEATRLAAFSVPKEFMQLAQTLVCCAEERGFDVLYRLLFRLQAERQILTQYADQDVAQALAFEKEVRRDCHKMKAFVRFKELPGETASRRKFFAWFEPDHFVVERTAPFFARRFGDMDFIIATPKGSCSFAGGVLQFSVAEARPLEVADATDDLWRTYYANIFNPARLKVQAMQAEMPRKYWKNLPEASLIPDLIAHAEQRALAMQALAPTAAPAHVGKIKAKTVERPVAQASFSSLAALTDALHACQRCPLHSHATQAVTGEGPDHAKLMLVGEQPGDQEDLQGHPFVGPAGQILVEVLRKAGIERSQVYLTNAVKHFKFTPRGKRRIHERPNGSEITHCRWWLQQEIGLVQPRVIVALGATALFALTGRKDSLKSCRGSQQILPDGSTLLVTYHPSALLRTPDPLEVGRMRQDFEADIRAAVQLAAMLDQGGNSLALPLAAEGTSSRL